VVAYSIAYPIGVLVPMLMVLLSRRIFGDPGEKADTGADAPVHRTGIRSWTSGRCWSAIQVW